MANKLALVAFALSIAISVPACSDDPQDQSPQAVIQAPSMVDERATATLNGQGSVSGAGTITVYQWAILNADGVAVSLSNSTTATPTLVVGEIGEPKSITVRLTVTNSGSASASAEQTIQLRELDRAALPAKPSVADSKATLLGVDADADSVRDDVEHSIYDLYPLDASRRQALLIGAKALQMGLSAGSTADRPMGDAASEQSARFAACMVAAAPDTAEADYFTLLAYAVNTLPREQAYRAYEQSRAGTIQRTITPATGDCSFDR